MGKRASGVESLTFKLLHRYLPSSVSQTENQTSKPTTKSTLCTKASSRLAGRGSLSIYVSILEYDSIGIQLIEVQNSAESFDIRILSHSYQLVQRPSESLGLSP